MCKDLYADQADNKNVIDFSQRSYLCLRQPLEILVIDSVSRGGHVTRSS